MQPDRRGLRAAELAQVVRDLAIASEDHGSPYMPIAGSPVRENATAPPPRVHDLLGLGARRIRIRRPSRRSRRPIVVAPR